MDQELQHAVNSLNKGANLAFYVGDWRVEPDLNRIQRSGENVHLEPKVMEVLLCLSRAKGSVISKEQLIRQVWPDTFVTDDVLKVSIWHLRKAFHDDSKHPSVIETIPKGGYRLLLPVRTIEIETHDSIQDLEVRRKRRLVVAALLLVGLIASISLALPVKRALRKGHVPEMVPAYAKIAVLPFVNLSLDPQQEIFSDGLTEEMISQLGSLQPDQLGVIARTTAMQYKGTKKSAREIGTELSVDYVLESSVQRAGDRVRITTQLIGVHDQTHLWSESYDRDLRDILLLRRDVAQAVAHAVQIKLTPQQRAILAPARPLNPQAYDLYLKGMYYTEKEYSPAAYEKGRQFFQLAIDADPTHAPPYAALANIYVELTLWGLLSHQEALSKAKAAALQSLELDKNLSDAHAALGNVRFMLEWDWRGADNDFRRATELHLAPRLTSARRYARYLMLTGRAHEGLAFVERMIELDPLSTDMRVGLGWVLKYAHRYDEGIRHLEQMLEQDPNLPPIAHYHLSWNYAMAGKYPEAVAECEKAHNTQPCAYAHAAWGHRDKALALARENERDDPVFTAAAYVALGDKDKAMKLLERGYQQHLTAMVYIWAASELEPLHSDPRFLDLLRRMNFPPYN